MACSTWNGDVMTADELESWIQYHDARFPGFKRWCKDQLATPEGAAFFADTFRDVSHAECCQATAELDARAAPPRTIAENARAVRDIIRRRAEARTRPPRGPFDPVLHAANIPLWVGLASQAAAQGGSIRDAAEYWLNHWAALTERTPPASPARPLAAGAVADCRRRIEIIDAFAGLEPEAQDRYLRRARALLPALRECNAAGPLAEQAAAFALFDAERRAPGVSRA